MRSNAATIRTQRACAWCGPAMVVCWLVGFWALARFVPPPSPALSTQQLADLYNSRTTQIRLGLLLTVIGSPLLGPFFTAISTQLSRIEGRYPMLANLQLAFAAILVLEFIAPLMYLEAAAFRAERDPAATQALSDTAWIWFVGLTVTAIVQLAAIGVAVLQDERTEPVFPRWSGYLSLWAAALLAPAPVVQFFKTGPLAWDGLFTWWIPLSAFCVWTVVFMVVLLRAITQHERELAAEPDPRETIDRLAAELAALRARVSPPAAS